MALVTNSAGTAINMAVALCSFFIKDLSLPLNLPEAKNEVLFHKRTAEKAACRRFR